MTRPLIVLDFDGVFNMVNDLNSARSLVADATQVVVRVERGENVRNIKTIISPSAVDFIKRVADADVVDLEWMTSWYSDTEFLPKAMGFPVMVWHDDVGAEDSPSQPWWKLGLIKSFSARNIPILWIDDDIALDKDAPLWLRDNKVVQAISPKTYKGITLSEMKEITAFIERHTGVRIV